MRGNKPVPLYSPKDPAVSLAAKPRIFVEHQLFNVAKAIEDAGRQVKQGSLGHAEKVHRSGNWVPLRVDYYVPEAAEQEVLFLSLRSEELQGGSLVEHVEDGARALWQSCELGQLDTKPFIAHLLQDKFDEVLEHGGIFVLELSAFNPTVYQLAESRYDRPKDGKRKVCSSWGMLSALNGMVAKPDSGSEITFVETSLGRAIAQGAGGASYTCALEDLPEHWTPLAHNKRGKIVSASYQPPEGEGLILLLPTMPQLPTIIDRLFNEVFPEAAPSLFPEYKAQAWVHDDRYESPSVMSLNAKRQELDAEYEAAIKANEDRIQAERASYEHYYTLLRGTGDELVAAVIRTLDELGFQQIKDVDSETRPTTNLVEDIQILDREPKLIVDVKGVAGHPSDSECQQAQKHALMRMREWKTSEVQSLMVINSQRLIPPDQRDETAYRDEMIQNAQDVGAGLMTTWDLFRIARAVQEFGWPQSAAQDILYQTGRIERIPSHYKPVGTITNIWKPAFAAELSDTINQGDRFGVLTPEGYFESVAESIELDDKSAEQGAAGQKIGIALQEGTSKLRKGMTLYRIGTLSTSE